MRTIAEMLAAQDRETVRPDDLGAAEKAELRALILGTWEPDAETLPMDSPEDRLRMQDMLDAEELE